MINSENNSEQTMKTIGILGGLGPQATMDLEMRLHKVAQQMIPQEKNSGYPLMAVQYYRHAPVLLVDENTPLVPFQPDPRLLKVAGDLGVCFQWRSFIAKGNRRGIRPQSIKHDRRNAGRSESERMEKSRGAWLNEFHGIYSPYGQNEDCL